LPLRRLIARLTIIHGVPGYEDKSASTSTGCDHLYCAVNALLVVIWAASGAGCFWPIWPIAGWGIALALHAQRVFGQKPISEADMNEEMQRVESPPYRPSP